jgi:tripartite-type tricarboxylate transporter receptor subunit TctC
MGSFCAYTDGVASQKSSFEDYVKTKNKESKMTLKQKLSKWSSIGLVWTSAIFALSFCQSIAAQGYPTKPIRLIVPYAPGGGVDIVARILADYISNTLKKPVIVENRTGAGGSVGSGLVAKSEPDGYTLLLASNSNAVNNSLYSNMTHDASKDLVPISLIGTVPMVLLVSPSISVKTVAEMIALAKAKPGTLNFGSGGNGTGEHLAYEMFKRQTGIDIQHIPYRGGATVYSDLLGGQIQFMFNNQLGASSYIRSGQLAALGISGDKRSALFPDLPTFSEQGLVQFTALVWWGIMGPSAIPRDTLAQINGLFNTAINSPEITKRLESMGAQTQGNTPEYFARFFKAEVATWSTIIRDSNIKLTQ